jgi:hypothetical protein
VVGQTSGTWGQTIEVPGSATLKTGGNARVSLVSCASAGNCTVGGSCLDSAGQEQVFVASQVNGA